MGAQLQNKVDPPAMAANTEQENPPSVSCLRQFWNQQCIAPMRKMFNLRQTVIMLSIIDSTMSAIYLLLLLLGGQHAQNMSQMADEDAWVVAHDETLPRGNNNGVRMHQGQKLAHVTLESIRLCIFMMGFHFICSISLFYAAVTRHREVLTLWLATMFFTILASVAFLVFLVTMNYDTKEPILCLLFALGTLIYCLFWLLTFKFHRQLVASECRQVGIIAVTTRVKASVVKTEKEPGPISKPQYV